MVTASNSDPAKGQKSFEVYHTKRLILNHTVHILKCVFDTEPETARIIDFVTNRDVRLFVLELFKAKASVEEMEVVKPTLKYFETTTDAYKNIWELISKELNCLKCN